MRLVSLFRSLTKFEWCLWMSSVVVVTISFFLSPDKNVLNLIDSLIGVTALIFISKGYVIGQVLLIIFGVLYGVISFEYRYYGEIITYLGMTAPIAGLAVISWLRHPYKDSKEVEVNRHLKLSTWLTLIFLTTAVTVGFYFILKALGNSNLLFSTISVTTSFLAASLTFLRSPYYGLGYAANDAVLITLWVLAALEDPGYVPMIFCFVMFFINDLYGFFNWRRMSKRQQGSYTIL